MIPIAPLNISLEEVVNYLKITDVFGNATQEVVRRKLAVAEASRYGLSITDEELQEAADIFRASKNLFTVDDTEQWMKRIGITTEIFESYIETSLIVEKFKDRLDQELDTFPFLSDHIILERLRELKFQKWFEDMRKED